MDWIRVLATAAVFLYHCSMFFNPFPWHVKNNELGSDGILVFSLFVGAWIMPIFFAVSGISTSYALRKRRANEYIKERLVRLGVPLLFGVMILTPPQVYIERLVNGQFRGSLFEFLPHFFDGVYLDFGGEGNFAFFGLHLWYLLVLLIFSLLTLPLFQKMNLKNEIGKIHFIVMPFILFLSGVVHTQALGGWDLGFYLIVFIYGFYVFSSPSFKEIVRSTFIIHFLVAVVTSSIYILWFMDDLPVNGSMEEIAFFAIRTINCWSWVICIFYLADKYFSSSNRSLKYGSEASMPFYVLHQPIIVILGFLIKDLPWSVPVKLLFLITAAFAVIMLIYHIVIRRLKVLRFLFGMK